MSRRRMRATDAAWLHMDRAVNRMVVDSVMWFDEPLDWDVVTALLSERMIDVYPPFSQRVVETPRGVWWEDVPDFEITDHLRRATLPAPGGVTELQAYVSDAASHRLDRHAPLWEMHLVDGFRGSGCAIVSRIHHCVADGVALARVLLSLSDTMTAAEAGAEEDDEHAHRLRPFAAMASAAHIATHLAGEALTELGHPRRAAHDALTAAAAGRALARVVGLPPDARTSLRGPLGEAKATVWSDPFALAALRDAAHQADVTVNDLVLSALSGALRTFVARHDGIAPDVRVVVPVNLRDPALPLPRELGNDFGLMFLNLPTGVDDPDGRLREVRRRTLALKATPEPVVAYRVLELAGHAPYRAEQVLIDLFTMKASGVVTNVIGPAAPVFVAGRRLRGMTSWPPESGSLAIGVSVISYDGEIVVGVMANERLIGDPRPILEELTRELNRAISAPVA